MRKRLIMGVVVAGLVTIVLALVPRFMGHSRTTSPRVLRNDPRDAGTVSPPAPEAPTKWVLLKFLPPQSHTTLVQSDSFAWNDERVRAWVDVHAAVLTVDPAADAETARVLALDDAPALLAFKDYREFDRIPLHQSPRSLLDWFACLERGERSIEQVARLVTHSNDPAERAAASERWGRARALLQDSEYFGATDEYLWLWQNIGRVDYCRPTALENDVEELIDASADARERFEDLRDHMLSRLGAAKVPPRDVFEFVELNRVLDDSRATIAWYERVRHDRRYLPLIRTARNELCGPLVRAHRWREVGDLMDDPWYLLENARLLEQAVAATPDPTGNAAKAAPMLHEYNCSEVSLAYVAMLGIGKESEASRYAQQARSALGSSELTPAMIRLALSSGEVRREHLDWLSAEAPSSENRRLRQEVAIALARRLMCQPLC